MTHKTPENATGYLRDFLEGVPASWWANFCGFRLAHILHEIKVDSEDCKPWRSRLRRKTASQLSRGNKPSRRRFLATWLTYGRMSSCDWIKKSVREDGLGRIACWNESDASPPAADASDEAWMDWFEAIRGRRMLRPQLVCRNGSAAMPSHSDSEPRSDLLKRARSLLCKHKLISAISLRAPRQPVSATRAAAKSPTQQSQSAPTKEFVSSYRGRRLRGLLLKHRLLDSSCLGNPDPESHRRARMYPRSNASELIDTSYLSSSSMNSSNDFSEFSSSSGSSSEQPVPSWHVPTETRSSLIGNGPDDVGYEIRSMGLRDRWVSTGAATYPTSGDFTCGCDEGDSTCRPFPPVQGRDPWPTLAVEASCTQSLEQLRTKMRWWFECSRNQVKVVILIGFDEKNGVLTIESWKEIPEQTEREGATAMRGIELSAILVPRCGQTITITKKAGADVYDPDSYVVNGGGLRLDFQLLFLRPPSDGEGDIVVSVRNLQIYATKIWG